VSGAPGGPRRFSWPLLHPPCPQAFPSTGSFLRYAYGFLLGDRTKTDLEFLIAALSLIFADLQRFTAVRAGDRGFVTAPMLEQHTPVQSHVGEPTISGKAVYHGDSPITFFHHAWPYQSPLRDQSIVSIPTCARTKRSHCTLRVSADGSSIAGGSAVITSRATALTSLRTLSGTVCVYTSSVVAISVCRRWACTSFGFP